MTKIAKTKTVATLVAGWLLYVFAQWWFVRWIINETGHVQMHKWDSPLSAWESFALTVVFYPIVEELIFRLPLKPTSLNLVIGMVAAIWLSLFHSELDALAVTIGSELGIRVAIALVFGFLLIWVLAKGYFDRISLLLTRLSKGHLMVFSAFVFALIHLDKIDYDSWIYAAAFILVIYFAHGMFFGYVRVKLNIGVAIAFHVATNSIPYILILYFSVIRNENLFKYL